MRAFRSSETPVTLYQSTSQKTESTLQLLSKAYQINVKSNASKTLLKRFWWKRTTLNQGTSDIRLKDKKGLKPSNKANDCRQQLESGAQRMQLGFCYMLYAHILWWKKDERCGLETVILTIPNRDPIKKEDVSSRLPSLYSDPTITARLFAYLAQPSRILRCNTRVWQMWRLFEPKKNSSHTLILTAIHWTKRRGPRLMTNLNIFILLWYVPYAKRSK